MITPAEKEEAKQLIKDQGLKIKVDTDDFWVVAQVVHKFVPMNPYHPYVSHSRCLVKAHPGCEYRAGPGDFSCLFHAMQDCAGGIYHQNPKQLYDAIRIFSGQTDEDFYKTLKEKKGVNLPTCAFYACVPHLNTRNKQGLPKPWYSYRWYFYGRVLTWSREFMEICIEQILTFWSWPRLR